MGKYTNAWSDKKTYLSNHDCANDGTCGQSITDFRIGNSDISFHDNYGRTIAQIPKLPNGNSITYYNNLYKTAQSKNFGENTRYVRLQYVLPNQFNYRCKDLDFTINFDSLSQREQDQVKMDIQSAYDAYKAKFCIDKPEAVQIYIFNNQDDYRKYGTLIPRFAGHQSMIDKSGGMASGEILMCYKTAYMDNVLAHELGHVFQFKFSPTKVRELDYVNVQLMANAIGLEVEEKNYKAICKQMGVDEYEDRGWMFKFKYKDTTCSIYRTDLSEEEKFQIIQRVKSSGLDEYEDRGSMFTFKYKGTTYNVRYKDFSEDEKFQFIKDIKNSHESLVSECDGLGNKNTTLFIYFDENKEISQMYFRNYDKNIFKQLDKTLISRSKSEEEVNENSTNPEPEEEQKGDDYTEFTGVLQFKYKGTNYDIQHRGYLSAEEEKLQFIKDIKNSHESLVSECDGLGNENTALSIYVDENKEISRMFFRNPDKNIFKQLDKTLISRSKSEEEVNENSTNPEPEEEQKGDDYTEFTGVLQFKYKGTNYDIQHRGYLSAEEEKLQFIKDIKNSHESLVSECDGLGNKNTTLFIYFDENKEISQMYFRNYDKNIFKQLDKTLISRSKSEEEVNENSTNPEPEEEQKGDDYTEFTGVLQFKYKGTNYDIQHRGYLSAEEEKLQFIKDIKNSHESLVSECDGLGNENTALSIYVDENKEISRMFFRNPDKNIFKQLDKTLISRSKPEEDVDDTAGKEPEPESAEEDTQQPSNFLSNIFSAIKSVIDSISSLFSWLFRSKEEKSDDNLSLFKLDANELDHDVRDHLSDNYNHYNSSDGLM